MSGDRESIPFGVGCFYFVPTEPIPETGQSERYRELIRRALEQIPNANNISIEGGEDFDKRLLPRWLSLHSPDFGTCPLFLNIEFDLYIPARIQEQVLDRLRGGFVESEHFHVKLFYHFMPVVMITATEPGGWEEGSAYIVLVREYLKRELDPSVVGLSCLGPSPFHSDFFLELVQQQDRPLVVRRERPADGYSQHRCSCEKPKHDENWRQVLREVLYELSPELTAFYEACRHRELRMKAWEEIEDPVRTSLLGDGRGRWRDAAMNRLRQSRSIRLVTDRLIRFEMDGIFRRQALEESFDRTYSVPGRAYLRDDVEKAVKDLGEYPIDEVYRLIGFAREGDPSR